MFDFDFAGQYARQIKAVSINNSGAGRTVSEHPCHPDAAWQPDADQTVAERGWRSFWARPRRPRTSAFLRVNWRSNQQIRPVDRRRRFGDVRAQFRRRPVPAVRRHGCHLALAGWKMPKEANLIDYSTISDIVVKVRYTALAGGKAFTDAVRGMLRNVPYLGRLAPELRLEFPSQLVRFPQPRKRPPPSRHSPS